MTRLAVVMMPSLSGALAEPVVRMTVDRPYPSGMGLQPLRPLGAADPYKVLLTDV